MVAAAERSASHGLGGFLLAMQRVAQELDFRRSCGSAQGQRSACRVRPISVELAFQDHATLGVRVRFV